ncbi:WD-REPEATS-REGION domain-containing protein [Mycena venus]|uniref:WD-REPEATS-REGION domain-containing protein n=1 Tax=Mycena venus TaxID=2733690 RepID=A0A8H7DDR1_9AGAR|nr:WD-REPEATS-REGION domain-containing protein [Mycena venus]
MSSVMTTPKRSGPRSVAGTPQSAQRTPRRVISAPLEPSPREEPADVFWDEDRSDVEEGEVDEEFNVALEAVRALHSRKCLALKRLLERAHASSAAQLHALQAELQMLRAQPPPPAVSSEDCSCRKGYWSGYILPDDDVNEEEPVPGFSASTIRRLPRAERSRLLRTLLDASLPGDIPLQILTLQKYAKLSHDIVGALAPPLALRVLILIPIPHLLLRCALVNRRWAALTRLPRSLAAPLPPPHARGTRIPRHRPRTPPAGSRSTGRSQGGRATSAMGPRRRCASSRPRTRRSQRRSCCARGGSLAGRMMGRYGSGTSRRGSSSAASRWGNLLAVWITWLARRCSWWGSTTLDACTSSLPSRTRRCSSSRATSTVSAPSQSARRTSSARGADKALVCWDWRAGSKIVRFGQQTTVNVGVQIVQGSDHSEGERVVSVTIDGVVRVFSIQRREMISQFRLAELGGGDPVLSAKLWNVGRAPDNMLQWFAAKGTQMTCATKSVILHLQWQEGESEAEPVPVPVPGSAGASSTTKEKDNKNDAMMLMSPTPLPQTRARTTSTRGGALSARGSPRGGAPGGVAAGWCACGLSARRFACGLSPGDRVGDLAARWQPPDALATPVAPAAES